MKKFLSIFLTIYIVSCTPNKNNSGNKTLETNQDTITAPVGFDYALDKISPQTIIVYDKLDFGNGYNSVTGREYFGVLDYENAEKSTEVSANALGNTGKVTMKILESKEDLKNILDITAKVELDFKIYGFSSDNTIKGQMYKETKFSDFRQNAVLKAEYVNEPKVLINPTVKKEWIKLANRDPDEFMRTCGDMFVSRIYTGGNLFALFSLHNRDTYEKEKNELFLKSVNKYLGNKLDVELNVKQMNENQKSIKNITTEIITEGGGKTPTEASLEAYIQYANEFKEQVSTDQRSIILYVELTPYEAIAGFPKIDFNKIRVVQHSFLKHSIELYNAIEASIANANFVLKNKEYFNKIDEVLAKAILQKTSDYTTKLRILIANCESDFNDCDSQRLALFKDFTKFTPKIDYPELDGIEVPLPITVDNNYFLVWENTAEGKIISIEGLLESRLANDRSKIGCQEVIHKGIRNKRRLSFPQYNKYLKSQFNKLFDFHEYHELPYYMIGYFDVKTDEFLREFKWNGTPFKTESNVKVKMKLVNPESKIQSKYNGKWEDLGVDFEKIAGYKRKQVHIALRQCKNDTIRAVVSKLDAPKKVESAKPLMLSNSNSNTQNTGVETFPETTIKDGYLSYEFDTGNN